MRKRRKEERKRKKKKKGEKRKKKKKGEKRKKKKEREREDYEKGSLEKKIREEFSKIGEIPPPPHRNQSGRNPHTGKIRCTSLYLYINA